MAGSKDKIIETLQSVDTVLVTVGKNPSVDELSAALGITIYLNEMGKHATAVMSGDIPPAISFLEPEKTFENTVNSLRDFVIALDKDKADHLRYKLVDDVVKIFITPYRTVITEKDLNYSMGDYNVELVIAIGVKDRDDLDKALSSHGRILHDATVATIGNEQSKLGDPDWYDREASSLSEMITSLVTSLASDKKMDKRVASALLTGIVSATERFSNDKTTPGSLNIAAELMSYGANQQLIALKLREGSKLDIQPDDGSKKLVGDIAKEASNSSSDNKKRQDNKKQNKQQPKDRTKFSINHSEDEILNGGKRNQGNNKKIENFPKPDSVSKFNDSSKIDEPAKDANSALSGTNPEIESIREEETAAPAINTADQQDSLNETEAVTPSRIGLEQGGDYDPAAALDQALKISEQKRIEDTTNSQNQLADELAKSIDNLSVESLDIATQDGENSQSEQLLEDSSNKIFDESDMPSFEESPILDEYTPSPQESSAPIITPETTQTPEQKYEVVSTPVIESNPAPKSNQVASIEQPQINQLPNVEALPQIEAVRQSNITPLSDSSVRLGEPTFGGTLNATAEGAAEAKRIAESEMRNHKILNRGTPGEADNGLDGQELNSVSNNNTEPFNNTVSSTSNINPSRDYVSVPQNNNMSLGNTANIPTQSLVPPTPSGTLDEIDRMHRQPIEEADVRDMFEVSSQPLPMPSVPIGRPVGNITTPNTPPPPPMPDFSQLPPLPAQMPDFSQIPAEMPADSPDLGQIFPPAPQGAQYPPQPNDPGQFKIPSQQ